MVVFCSRRRHRIAGLSDGAGRFGNRRSGAGERGRRGAGPRRGLCSSGEEVHGLGEGEAAEAHHEVDGVAGFAGVGTGPVVLLDDDGRV